MSVTPYTISINGAAYQTAESLGISVATRRLVNRGIDTVSLTVVPATFDTTPPMVYGDTVQIKRGSVLWFQGMALDAQLTASSKDHFQQIDIVGPWFSIGMVTYMQTFAFNSADKLSSRTLIGSTEDDSGTVNFSNTDPIRTATPINKALTYAQNRLSTSANKFDFDPVSNGIYMNPEEHTDASITDIVNSVMRYHPTAQMWVDYSQTRPTIRCASRAANRLGGALGNITFDISEIRAISIKPRNDLILPGVVIRYESPASQLTGNIITTPQTAYGTIGNVDYIDAVGTSPTVPVAGSLVTSMAVDGNTTWVTSAVSGPQLGVPSNLAQFIYDEHLQLHYEGSITFVDDDPGGRLLMGNMLNLSGSLQSAWLTMKAVIQGVTENMQTGETTITFGPAPGGFWGLGQWKRMVGNAGARGVPKGKPIRQAGRDSRYALDSATFSAAASTVKAAADAYAVYVEGDDHGTAVILGDLIGASGKLVETLEKMLPYTPA